MSQTSDSCLDTWMGREALAEAMIPVIGRLYRENNVVTSIHGRSLINKSTMNILKAHRFARRMSKEELRLEETAPLLDALTTLDLGAAAIDIARLTEKYRAEPDGTSLDAFLRAELADVVGKRGGDDRTSTDVVLYGFGRIGRLLARLLIEKAGGGHGLRLRAIVVRRGSDNDLAKRASLLRRDSVHGPFEGTIKVDLENETITANGVQIQVIYSDNPATVDYAAYGIQDALVVDNTGRWRDADGLSQHLQSKGVARVLLTAPGKGELKNIVHGINHGTILDSDKIVTAASCTTNAITPVLKAINDRFGVVHGHVETVHSFTNDQNLIDNFHKGDRRGRSAALNMVITETGAAKAVAKALPELLGQAHRQLHPRPHPGCVPGHPEPEPGERHHQGRGQRLPAARCRCTRTCASRSTTSIRPRWFPRTSSAPAAPASSTASPPSPTTRTSCSTSGTTTSSATAARWSA